MKQVKNGVHINKFRSVDWLQLPIASDILNYQTSESKLKESFFVLKKFILEAIVQVAWSLGIKSLDTY